MFWSDCTHLTNFGMAKMWPVYMMFGNLSKYIHVLSNLGACHHIAYIPFLSDIFLNKISGFFAKWNIKTQCKDLIMHLHCELMHAIWALLLDEEFMHAYKYGIVVKCYDRITRRIYP